VDDGEIKATAGGSPDLFFICSGSASSRTIPRSMASTTMLLVRAVLTPTQVPLACTISREIDVFAVDWRIVRGAPGCRGSEQDRIAPVSGNGP